MQRLHYRGDRTAFDPERIVGPDRFAAYYAPVSASYDAETDVTTIEYRPVPPAEMQQRIDHHIETQLDPKAQIANLFGAVS